MVELQSLLNQLVRKIKEIVKDLPFLLLCIDAVWWVLSFYGIYSNDFWIIQEIASHSLTFTLVLSFYAYLHRYCLYSWVCIIGLGLLNILNITYFFVTFNYYHWYAGLIIIPCLIFTLIKWNQHRFYKNYSGKV